MVNKWYQENLLSRSVIVQYFIFNHGIKGNC